MRSAGPIVIAVAVLSAAPAHAERVLDRIAATVGLRSILLSEVRDRAALQLRELPAERRAAAQAAISNRVLETMIEEQLIERDADRVELVVVEEEVDRAMEAIAMQRGVATSEILREATVRGVTAQAYRGETRRRLLEAKWIDVVVRPISFAQGGSIQAARKKRLEELRRENHVEVLP